MLDGSIVKAATASMSREIFLVFGSTVFLSGIRNCNTVIVIFLGDLSTLSHIRFLRLSSPRRLPPLEMTGKGWSHRRDYGIPENAPSLPRHFEQCDHPLWLYCPKSLQLRRVKKSLLRTGVHALNTFTIYRKFNHCYDN